MFKELGDIGDYQDPVGEAPDAHSSFVKPYAFEDCKETHSNHTDLLACGFDQLVLGKARDHEG